ncbi:MAG: GrpB family protein [Clostridiaceae bacterium]|nr:GrpB family protein [Clostridiaceae bacterium]
MTKSLADMTNEERWRLFPIILREHDPQWKTRGLDEMKLLTDGIGAENIEGISHIGSTSVTGLVAKPTIDILLEIKEDTDLDKLIANIKAVGYIFSRQEKNPPPHMMFMKGYTPEGFRGQAFHVHVRYSGDWNELYFRDYLINHPETAAEYGRIKQSLKEEYEFDRDAYTKAKSEFINRVTDLARIEYKNRYKPVRMHPY